MKLPTREVVQAVRERANAVAKRWGGEHRTHAEATLALCDLALRVLDAPEREAYTHEREMWSTCPTCSAAHGYTCSGDCEGDDLIIGDMGAHPARLAAAPTRVRLVAVSE